MLLVFLVGEENASRGFLLFFRLQRYEKIVNVNHFCRKFFLKSNEQTLNAREW